MARKYFMSAALLAVFMAFAGVTPAAAQEPAPPEPAAAAYGALVTAIAQTHVQLEAAAEADLETANVNLVNVADVVPAGDAETFDSLIAQHGDNIEHLRSSIGENAELSGRIAGAAAAAGIEEDAAAFMQRVVAIEVDREDGTITVFFDGR
jgi:hypothetical protein